MRVLIIEDNRRLAELISHGIAQHGFSGDGVGSIEEAEAALASVAFADRPSKKPCTGSTKS